MTALLISGLVLLGKRKRQSDLCFGYSGRGEGNFGYGWVLFIGAIVRMGDKLHTWSKNQNLPDSCMHSLRLSLSACVCGPGLQIERAHHNLGTRGAEASFHWLGQHLSRERNGECGHAHSAMA